MRAYSWRDDPALREFIDAAAADADTVGLLLGGSRGAGWADDESDYDLTWVLSDAAHDRRQERGEPLRVKLPADERRAGVDLLYTCPRRLAELAARPGWWTPGYAASQVVLDKTGQLAAIVEAMRSMPEGAACATAAAAFDGYLNAFYRSMKAWRRGDELGGRLQAAASAMALVRALFALERRPAPYYDRLVHELDTLSSQGWPPGSLRDDLLGLLRTGAPALQATLATRVEALIRARGLGHVIDAWEGEIERVKALADPAEGCG